MHGCVVVVAVCVASRVGVPGCVTLVFVCLLVHGPDNNLVPPRGTKAHMFFLIGR